LVSIFNEEKSFETEFTITNAKGVEKTLFLSVNYPKDDDYSKVIYGLLDITDLRQSINALRDSEFRYRTMFENNKLGVIYANHQTDVIRFNEAFFQMFGYSMNELSLIEENAILLPQYIDESNRLYRQLENGNIRNFQMEKEYKTRSGNNIYVNTSVTGLYDEKDQYYGSVTIIEDVSEKKKSQQKIEIQNVELKKINAELDQFVYSAAHDLRAPIANVQGLLQLIRHEQISEQALAYLDLQEKSLEKLDHFISNIVNFSRNSRLNLDLSNISPIALISESIEHHRFAPNANKLDVKLEISEDIAFTSDANRLNVVINNLVSNAIRYMDLRKTTNQLVISVRLEGAKVYFVFRDNGLGIEHSYQDQIFDLFFRAHENSNGTGIGLYLVKETVEKLGGEIIVNSVPGAFTEFSFYIANQD
jgi:PAS domain S-box-containing protein